MAKSEDPDQNTGAQADHGYLHFLNFLSVAADTDSWDLYHRKMKF